MALLAVIDSGVCEGHGLCALESPGIFDVDADGYGVVALSPVPEELRAQAERAALSCPMGAIAVESAAETD
jgi:ferredoxin